MGLEAVVEEVISGAQEKARKIIAEGKKEAKRILREAEKEAKTYEEKFREETAKILEEMKRREIASAKLETAKVVMNARKKIIDDFLNSVVESLAGMNGKEKEGLLNSLAKMAKEEMEVAVVYCNRKEEDLIKKLFPKAKMKHIECKGGFITENKDGSISMDLTYETLVSRIKLDLLKILNSKLEKA